MAFKASVAFDNHVAVIFRAIQKNGHKDLFIEPVLKV